MRIVKRVFQRFISCCCYNSNFYNEFYRCNDLCHNGIGGNYGTQTRYAETYYKKKV